MSKQTLLIEVLLFACITITCMQCHAPKVVLYDYGTGQKETIDRKIIEHEIRNPDLKRLLKEFDDRFYRSSGRGAESVVRQIFRFHMLHDRLYNEYKLCRTHDRMRTDQRERSYDDGTGSLERYSVVARPLQRIAERLESGRV